MPIVLFSALLADSATTSRQRQTQPRAKKTISCQAHWLLLKKEGVPQQQLKQKKPNKS
jgi:hypothetical protein